MKKTKDNKGITLLALVIIIVAIVIFVCISIMLVLRQVQKTHTLQETEKKDMITNNKGIELEKNTNKIENDKDEETKQEQLLDKWSEVYKTTQKDNYTDKSGKKATIPAGFQVSLNKGETEIETGLVIRNATDKNEFVWIPVDDIKDYKRIAFLSNQPVASDDDTKIMQGAYYYTETMPLDEKTSIERYKGYYIGRYEAGIASAEQRSKGDTKATAEKIEAESGKMLSQKGKNVYNYVTSEQAKKLAGKLYTKANDNVTSKLCSSYAWDTALTFIAKKYPNYPTNSLEGNYKDTTFEYTSIDGIRNIKSKNSTSIVLTGQTTALNNIYDMGGNVWEWTTEEFNVQSFPSVRRGGEFFTTSSSHPVARRTNDSLTANNVGIGFRVTLYL